MYETKCQEKKKKLEIHIEKKPTTIVAPIQIYGQSASLYSQIWMYAFPFICRMNKCYALCVFCLRDSIALKRMYVYARTAC